mmetsp:Transcript_14237/g.38701  ORF Transcript_14237/g.38701 Transcript_14237/m.38701 type:complete len:214 (-) Transcript_14237:987-1628(-)
MLAATARPARTARSNGVLARLSPCSSLAPAFKSKRTHSSWPLSAARDTAGFLSGPGTLTSAPHAMSISTQPTCPCSAAQWIAARPSLSFKPRSTEFITTESKAYRPFNSSLVRAVVMMWSAVTAVLDWLRAAFALNSSTFVPTQSRMAEMYSMIAFARSLRSPDSRSPWSSARAVASKTNLAFFNVSSAPSASANAAGAMSVSVSRPLRRFLA